MPSVLEQDEIRDYIPSNWRYSAQPPARPRRTFSYRLKLRFECAHCRNTWSSMKGTLRVKVWGRTQTHICAELFAQACRRCQTFADGDYYEHELEAVLENVVERVAQPRARNNVRSRQPGAPKKQHRSDECEACQAGCCSVES